MKHINNQLAGVRVAVPESRQLDTMVQLLERRGAAVMRIPLVAIHDAPDPALVLAWIRRFDESRPRFSLCSPERASGGCCHWQTGTA